MAKAYAIKDPKGKILIYTIHKKKKDSIWVFVGIPKIWTWKESYKQGCRCVPVLITEVKTDK